MDIEFFIGFDKRLNSTKRPGNNVVKYTLTGTLKEPSSVTSPVVNIQNIPISDAPCVFTYASIPRFFRYYFVKDWVWNNGLWTVQLEVDVLATYKAEIGNTYAYIERCAGVAAGETDPYYDGRIIDKLYPAKNDFTIINTNMASDCPWGNMDIDAGCYVLGVISRTTLNNVGGAVQYYALTQTQIRQLLEYMLNDQFYNDAGFSLNVQVNHDLAKCIVNPIQYITSCFWFPTGVSSFTQAQNTTINVGPWATIGQGKPIVDRIGYRTGFEVTLPTHPDAATRGEYLNYPPYTTYTCTLPPFGCFPIDPAYIPENKRIRFAVQVDGITGKADLQICDHDNARFHFLSSAMFGVPIQIAQINADYLKTASSVISGLAGGVGAAGMALSGHPIAAITSGLMSLGSIGNALNSAMPQVISDGVNGSFLAFERLTGTYTGIATKCIKLVDEDNTENGRPLCKVRQIKKLDGYIRCGEATVNFSAFDSELTSIHTFMLQGFFWE